MKPTTLCGFLLILLPLSAWAAPTAEDASEAFRRGEYGTAARMYRDLVDSHPRNADLGSILEQPTDALS